MTARRLARRPVPRTGPLPHLPRTVRSMRAYDLFWPVLALNTALQVLAVFVDRPAWYPWLQVLVTVAMVVLGVRFLMLRLPEIRAGRRSAARDRAQGRTDGVQHVQ